MTQGVLRLLNTVTHKWRVWLSRARRVLKAGDTVLSAAGNKLATLLDLAAPAARNLISLVPAKLWLIAMALVCAGLWLQEHDAKVRAGAELAQARQQSAQRIAALEAQASTAMRQANQRNAAAIAQLETRRAALAGQSAQLAAQLREMREKRATQRAELDALPASALKRRLSDQLGPSSVVRSPWSGVRGPSQGDGHLEAGSPVAPGNEPAVGTPPLQPTSGEQMPAVRTPPLQLTDDGQRQVLAALAERDACRDESVLRDRQFGNCTQRVEAGEAEIRTQADSLGKLNQALVAKDRILAEREAQYRAELRAARGTWRGRAWRAAKYVAVGFVVGVALR